MEALNKNKIYLTQIKIKRISKGEYMFDEHQVFGKIFNNQLTILVGEGYLNLN